MMRVVLSVVAGGEEYGSEEENVCEFSRRARAAW